MVQACLKLNKHLSVLLSMSLTICTTLFPLGHALGFKLLRWHWHPNSNSDQPQIQDETGLWCLKYPLL